MKGGVDVEGWEAGLVAVDGQRASGGAQERKATCEREGETHSDEKKNAREETAVETAEEANEKEEWKL